MQGSTPQATAKGAHVTVTGPFAPGSTLVQIGYELPYGGPTVRLRQVWPAALTAMSMYVLQLGEVDISSVQLPSKQRTTEQGQPLIFAHRPAAAGRPVAGRRLPGLPHQPRWPRNVALALAGVISAPGIWAAVAVARSPPRRLTAVPAPPGTDFDVDRNPRRLEALRPPQGARARVADVSRRRRRRAVRPERRRQVHASRVVSTLDAGQRRRRPLRRQDRGRAWRRGARAHRRCSATSCFSTGTSRRARTSSSSAGCTVSTDLETRVGAGLAAARLEERAGDRVASFSRGLRQRLALERALIHSRVCVLLDEPFTGLDDESAGAAVGAAARSRRAGNDRRSWRRTTSTRADGLDRRAGVCFRAGRTRELEPGPDRLRERYRRAMQEAWT